MALVIVAMIRRTDRLIVAEKAAGKSQVQIVKE